MYALAVYIVNKWLASNDYINNITRLLAAATIGIWGAAYFFKTENIQDKKKAFVIYAGYFLITWIIVYMIFLLNPLLTYLFGSRPYQD